MTIFFTRNATSHKTDRFFSLLVVACFVLPLLYAQVISLINVHELEHSGFHLLENSIETTILFMYCIHSICGCVLRSLQRRSANHDFTRNVTSHKADWILTTTRCLLCLALSCLIRDQSNEGSWTETFGFSPSRESYCDYNIVYVLHT